MSDASIIPASWPKGEPGRQLADGTPIVSDAVRALLQDSKLRRLLSHGAATALSDVVDNTRRGEADCFNENPARDPRLNRPDLIWALCLWLGAVSPSDLYDQLMRLTPDDEGYLFR